MHESLSIIQDEIFRLTGKLLLIKKEAIPEGTKKSIVRNYKRSIRKLKKSRKILKKAVSKKNE